MNGATAVPLMSRTTGLPPTCLVSNDSPSLLRWSLALSHSVNCDHGPTKMWKLHCAGSTLSVSGRLRLERCEVGVGGLGQQRKQREIGQRRDEAAGEDDLQAADLVAQPAEEDEERRADEQRGADQPVGVERIDLEGDGEEEQRVELPRVPDDALAGGGAEQRQQHVLVVRIAEEAVGDRRLGAFALRLHARNTGLSCSFSRM